MKGPHETKEDALKRPTLEDLQLYTYCKNIAGWLKAKQVMWLPIEEYAITNGRQLCQKLVRKYTDFFQDVEFRETKDGIDKVLKTLTQNIQWKENPTKGTRKFKIGNQSVNFNDIIFPSNLHLEDSKPVLITTATLISLLDEYDNILTVVDIEQSPYVELARMLLKINNKEPDKILGVYHLAMPSQEFVRMYNSHPENIIYLNDKRTIHKMSQTELMYSLLDKKYYENY